MDETFKRITLDNGDYALIQNGPSITVTITPVGASVIDEQDLDITKEEFTELQKQMMTDATDTDTINNISAITPDMPTQTDITPPETN